MVMTFREMIKLYQEGTLEDEQTERVKGEIEKHEAISDYLYEASQIPNLDGFDSVIADDTDEQEAKDFSKLVRKAIRRAFIKMGIVVGSAILAIVLAVIFLLPDLVSGFYYNPNEVVGTSPYGNETNRMSLDLAVYSELFLPEKYRETVIAEDLGYGKYSITIPQTISYAGRSSTVAGVLERNKLTLYSPDLLQGFPANAFILPENVAWSHRGMGAAGSAEDAFASLQELDENEVYTAYFSLDALTDYESVYEQVGTAWYAVYNEAGYYAGFWSAVNGSVFDWDQEKYPMLSTLYSGSSIEEIDANQASEDAMKTHFMSMLRYMQDHPETLDLFGWRDYQLGEAIEYVEANDLQIYGFAVIASKETILELAEAENIAYVYTTLYH
jgi:hypothetical protein